MSTDIIDRLKGACVGHPAAKIAWPHRLLHDAIAEIERLRKLVEASALSSQEGTPMAENNEAVLIQAVQDILNANDDFRKGMPENWEGDWLQDACDSARFLLIRMGVPVFTPLPPSEKSNG